MTNISSFQNKWDEKHPNVTKARKEHEDATREYEKTLSKYNLRKNNGAKTNQLELVKSALKMYAAGQDEIESYRETHGDQAVDEFKAMMGW